MRKFIKVLTALFLALSLTSLMACDIFGGVFKPSNPPSGPSSGEEEQPQPPEPDEYSVTFHADGGVITNEFNSYKAGETKNLPQTVTKDHYIFEGWFSDSDFDGNRITAISSTDTGDKEFYAKWAPEKYAVELYVNGAKYTGSDNINEYVYDTEVDLPVPKKSNYIFNGWYLSADCSGNKVTSIIKGEYGKKTFYAKWLPISSEKLELLSYGGYEEGAYVEFAAVDGVQADEYAVKYKKKTQTDNYYTDIDDELIRVSDGIVRADVVGIAAGEYTLQVTAGLKGEVTADVKVTAYDRSGYAHFNLNKSDYKDGVGAYKTDGTPKDNAYIIYVTESNKNSVVAPWSTKITGLTKLLGDVKNAKKPVIVRIIGRISAATWKEKDYSAFVDSNGHVTADIIANNTLSSTGVKLSKATHKQADLISQGYNSLNEYDGCTELAGLSSSIKYDSTKKEFDSCWNDCTIQSAKNLTVEGIGTDAEIFQWGMTFKSSNSIEVRNITFDDYTEDACSFEGSTSSTAVDEFSTQRVWLHHNTFNEGVNYWDVCNEQDKHDGDGSTDLKGVSYVTLSYNRYNQTHKTGLVGGDKKHMQANLTFHHNYYNECKSRLPLARQANMHMYNNYYHGSTSTSISIRGYAYAFIEYCYFDGTNNTMIDVQSYDSDTLNSYGVAKVYNCEMAGKGYSYSAMPSTEKPSEQDKYKAKEPFIYFVTDRAKQVASFNKFAPNFDTDSEKFYYNSAAKSSEVTDLITDVKTIPEKIPLLAGVHKN